MITRNDKFEPVIVGFTCNWCSYRAADAAGMARTNYAPNVHLIRLMCSGRLDPQFVLEAFKRGADGVLISGCHPGDCHYLEQNYKTLRRFALLKRTLKAFGIEEGRLKLMWASAAEGAQLAEEIDRMVTEVKKLGPLNWEAEASEIGDSRSGDWGIVDREGAGRGSARAATVAAGGQHVK